MRSRNVLHTLTCICVFLASCTNSDSVIEHSQADKIVLTQDEYISIAFDTPEEITENDVLAIVTEFSTLQTRSLYPRTPDVASKQYISAVMNGTGGKTYPIKVPVYEVNLNNDGGGYALVSADERIPCVIAYVEKGSIQDTIENIGAAMMIREAEKALLRNIAQRELLKDSLQKKVLRKIAVKLGHDAVEYKDIQDKIIVGDATTRSKVTTNPNEGTLLKEVRSLITTKWNQTPPYNDMMDTNPNGNPKDSYNGKNAVGCTAVAMAQIVARYECLSSAYGITLNWSDLKSSSRIYPSSDDELKRQVASLCKHVAIGIKTTWANGSGAANIKNSASYLNGLGITFDTGKKYAGYPMDAVRIVASLDDLCPVIITGKKQDNTRSTGGGGGHCWLLDGYQLRSRPTNARIIVRENDVYVHANFGWGGHEDGYYMVDRNNTSLDFETAFNGYYNQNLKIFPNVRRR